MKQAFPSEHGEPSLPPVTVVMPAYNQERFIEDAIASVQAQDYRGPIEILIWNDGSTDRTCEIIQDLQQQDPRIHLVSDENRGRPIARQQLLETAKTDLIAWLDPDDFAATNWLREQIEGIEANDSIVACGGQAYAMLADRDPVGPIERPLSHSEIHGIHLEGGVAINQTGVMTKRSALLAAGGYRERYKVGEDFDLWLRLAAEGSLTNLPNCHTFYRLHENSANWSAPESERALWYEILNQARERLGHKPRQAPEAAPPRKEDWNRRVFWINIAAREGNARSCLKMVATALKKHPGSLLLWLFGCVSLVDIIRFGGNRVARFQPGKPVDLREPPKYSFYQLARWINRVRRRIMKRGTRS